MPLREGHNDNVKVHRPVGVKFSEGTTLWTPSHKVQDSIQESMSIAVDTFVQEFGRHPDWDYVVVEVVCGTTRVHAALYELVPDDRSIGSRQRDAKAWNRAERLRREGGAT